MARNLAIYTSWETEEDYVFELALRGDDDTLMPLMGDNTVRISKATGEMN